jgi:hypothetical protein
MPLDLLASLRALLLEADERGLNLTEIAKITQRPRTWLLTIRDGTTPNPGVRHVEQAIAALRRELRK